MQRLLQSACVIFLLGSGIFNTLHSQNVGINTSGANPSTNAILDLNTGNSNNVGLIVPNVTLGALLTSFKTPGGPMANNPNPGDKGMLVYNSNAANQPIGYYYWNGATWVSVSGAGATVTAANDGVSLNGTTVILGGAYNSVAGQLTQNTEIPFNGNNINFSNRGGNGTFGIDLNQNTSAAEALEIGRTTNTIRVDGLKQFSSFYNNNGNAPLQSYMVFADNNGNLNSMAAGATNNVLTWTAGGPAWQAPAGAVTANNGLSVVGGNVELGGVNALLGNTNIVSGGFNLAFTGTGNFQLGSANNSTGELDFLNGATGNFVGISAGGTTTSYNLFLPLAQGAANTFLMNNGAGVLTWSAPAGATANNGLTVAGGNVQLGGANALLGNTTITNAGFNLAIAGTGKFQLGAGGASTGTLQFLNSTNANAIGISAGATTAAYNLTLPLAQGAAGSVLTNNGAGILTWGAAGGGSANNGLTVVGGNTQLGGANPLLANTNILTGGFNLGLTGGGALQLSAASASTGELDFFNGASALGVGLKAAATTTTYTLSLPVAPPGANGQVLASSVGGTLSWATIPAGGPGILIGIIYVTATTGTVNFAAGTTSVLVRAVGGGGAGGGIKHTAGCGTAADIVGGGGGAGGYCEGFVSGLGPGSTYQVNIGAGGVGVATCGAVNGGNTIVTITGPNTTFTANGGAGGPSYEAGVAGAFTGGLGGTAAGGSLNITGATGGWCSVSTTGTDGDFAGCGANSSFGSGGSSIYTRDHLAINGVSSTAPGAGGGGGVVAQSVNNDAAKGGDGGNGIVIIYEYQ